MDGSRARGRIGELPEAIMASIDQALRLQLAL